MDAVHTKMHAIRASSSARTARRTCSAWTTVPRPVRGAGEVLIAVRASSLNFADVAMVTGRPSLIRAVSGRQAQRGTSKDVAGIVEAVGASMTDLRPGDEVFGEAVAGVWAQCVCVPATLVARKPTNLAFGRPRPSRSPPAPRSTAQPGSSPGQKVVVNGASGGVGTFSIQMAKALGAEVTGVCSGRNVELVRGVGADHVVDYERSDFTRDGADRYDLIVDLVGNRRLGAYRRALAPHGTLHLSGGGRGPVPRTDRPGGPGPRREPVRRPASPSPSSPPRAARSSTGSASSPRPGRSHPRSSGPTL